MWTPICPWPIGTRQSVRTQNHQPRRASAVRAHLRRTSTATCNHSSRMSSTSDTHVGQACVCSARKPPTCCTRNRRYTVGANLLCMLEEGWTTIILEVQSSAVARDRRRGQSHETEAAESVLVIGNRHRRRLAYRQRWRHIPGQHGLHPRLHHPRRKDRHPNGHLHSIQPHGACSASNVLNNPPTHATSTP